MEPLVHLVIPTFVLIAFFPRLRNEILFLSPLSIIPDLDILLGKRMVFHNIFFALFVIIIVFLTSKIVFKKNKKLPYVLLLFAFFFLFTHLLLDIWGPGIALLYPFENKLYSFDFNMYMSPETKVISYELNFKTNPASEASKDQKSPFFSMIGVSILAMIALAVILSSFSRKFRKGKENDKAF
ncbi:MAG: metal-dependent hydrolase [Candidatus Woesearchaeota archaeon]